MKSDAVLGGGAIGRTPAEYLAAQKPEPGFGPNAKDNPEIVRQKFQEFVAGTFYQTMLAAMRKTVGKNKLVHGGKAEEVFRNQLDQTISGRLAVSNGDSLSGKLFDQFALQLGLSNPAGTNQQYTGNDKRATGTPADGPAIDPGRTL